MLDGVRSLIIRHAIKHPTPSQFNPEGGENNFKAAFLTFQDSQLPSYRVISKIPNGFICSCINSEKERYEASLAKSRLPQSRLMVRHWHKGIEVTYKGYWDYLWGTLSLYATRTRLLETYRQRRFNRSLKIRDDRIDILQALTQEYLRRKSEDIPSPFDQSIGIEKMDVPSLLHGFRVWAHPDFDAIHARVDLIVDSLIESSDLRVENGKIYVNGKALKTISDHVSDDRKHRDQKRYNRVIAWLTFGLFVATFAQLLKK